MYLTIMGVDKQAVTEARKKAREAASDRIKQAQHWSPESLAEAVCAGNRDALAQAITWVESCLLYTSPSPRD